ncbi:MAG: biopolymer transporter ExbD [Symploca sp. SIO2B6]|nr:biopolymer transporter ExbD [Symploca sp. SIO2B6]
MKSRANRRSDRAVPEINLVPMMDVLMTVLTFFIIISMTFGSRQIFSVEAPNAENASLLEDAEVVVEPFIVGLNANREILIQDDVVNQSELIEAVTSYLSDHPDGALRLKADQELDFEAASNVLVLLQGIAKGREIALVVE